jgi:hypothetical protein
MLRQRTLPGWIVLIVLIVLSFPADEPALTVSAAPRTALHFEPVADGAFVARGSGYRIALDSGGAAFTLRQSHTVQMTLIDANPTPEAQGDTRQAGVSNYFIGSDPAGWRTNVPNYGGVRYREVYPGIDLFYHGSERRLQYDFLLAPGADPDAIRLRFDGMERLELDANGDLLLHVGDDAIRQAAPYTYQEIAGERVEIASAFALLDGDEVGFTVGAYDPALPLVIDPTVELLYSTYLGGGGAEAGHDIAVDADGYIYVTGFTDAVDFPLKDPLFSAPIELTASATFIAKLTPDASDLVWSTYLGNTSSFEVGYSIAVGSDGSVFVAGFTGTEDFPVTANAYQDAFDRQCEDGEFSCANPTAAFLTKISAAGDALLYSTFIDGGNGEDFAHELALDASDRAYLVGLTRSSGFPATPDAVQSTNPSIDLSVSGFLTVIDTAQSGADSLVYSTYLGGTGNDEAWGVAVDAAGIVYITGDTASDDFPTTASAYQTEPASSNWSGDAFLTVMNLDGDLLYSTYLGGSEGDTAIGIAGAGNGVVYLAGRTFSDDFPTTPGTAQLGANEGLSGFVAKLDTTQSGAASLLYSLTLPAVAMAAAVDEDDRVYITGATGSGVGFPTTPDAFQSEHGVDSDLYLMMLSPQGDELIYSTLIGGSEGEDSGLGLVVGSNGAVYFTGLTLSTDFPTTPNVYLPAPPPPDPNEEAYGNAVIVVLGVDFEPACPNGTPGDDVLVCRESPPTFDNPTSNLEGGQGNDHITILEDVTVATVHGDMIPGEEPLPVFDGGDNTIHNHGTVGGGTQGGIVGSMVLGRAGNNTIHNHETGTVATIIGDGGSGAPGFSQTITNDGLVTGDILGSLLLDDNLGGTVVTNTITNNGTVQGDLTGSRLIVQDPNTADQFYPGDHAITNSGIVEGDIYGNYTLLVIDNDWENATLLPDSAGDHIITSSGRVDGAIYAMGGDVILQDGANGGDDNHLFIDGGAGTNTLTFEFEAPDQATYDQWTAAINSADPAAGSITFNGQTFEWVNFSALDGQFSITGVSVSFTINNQELYHAIQGQIALNPNAVVEFVLPQIVPAGVQMTVRLTNGTLGRVTVSIEDGGGFAVIQIGDMQVGGSPAPASFVNPVHNELPGLIAGALDALIFEEAGAAQGLESISISDNLIHITTQP